MSFSEFRNTRTALIDTAVSTTVSAAVELPDGMQVIGIITDAAWDTQNMTFQVSMDGVTYFVLYNESSVYTLTAVPASTAHALSFWAGYPWKYWKAISGAAQGDDTTVTFVIS